MMAWVGVASLCLAGPAQVDGALQRPDGAQLLERLLRLRDPARVLYVAAHPDDENTRFLAHLTSGERVEAAYLSLTRGGGGQNLIGDEQAGLLSVLRTEELSAARAVDGARQFFTRARDFGYSKRAEETLSIWDREAVRADVIRVLRAFRPDVVVTRFREGSQTHGHHLASAVLAREAFEAVTRDRDDPVPIRRLVLNVPTWGEEPEQEGQVKIDVGGYAPLRGETHPETAARSRSQHRSQGFGSDARRGKVFERFELVKGAPFDAHVLDGVPRTWRARFGEEGGAAVDRAFARAVEGFDPAAPHESIAAMLRVDRRLSSLPETPRVQDARARVAAWIRDAAGLFLRVTPGAAELEDPKEVEAARARQQWPLGAVDAALEAELRTPVEVRVAAVVGPSGERQVTEQALSFREPVRIGLEAHLKSPSTAPWLRLPVDGGTYQIPEAADPNLPDGGARPFFSVELEVEGSPLLVRVPFEAVWVERSRGELRAPVFAVPRQLMTPRHPVVWATGDAVTATFRVQGGFDPSQVEWSRSERTRNRILDVKRSGETLEVRLDVSEVSEPFFLRPRLGGERMMARSVVDADHVPRQVVLQPSEVRVVPMAAPPDLTVGYVMGPGDRMVEALRRLGFRVRVLSDEDLERRRYQGLDVIVTGVRAFNVRRALPEAGLFDWVESGGHLVVQYNTNSWYSKLSVPVGPKPLEIGRGRVTDENAKVTLRVEDHPLLSWPHSIGQQDFRDWVQERGLYFAESWDPATYTPLLSLADPGEDRQEGALLAATHGRGTYVYTGLSFFRQLPAGVRGAARLFVNILSHPFADRSASN
jgi:LmbE family N-acetylglucosaminyl deacetylase